MSFLKKDHWLPWFQPGTCNPTGLPPSPTQDSDPARTFTLQCWLKLVLRFLTNSRAYHRCLYIDIFNPWQFTDATLTKMCYLQ